MENIVDKRYVSGNFDDYLKENFSKEELELTEARANFLIELNALRKAQKLTQKDLEKKTGIKPSTIAKIERGTINPSFNNILKLLNAMGKTIKIASL